jgi:hypothetical protein
MTEFFNTILGKITVSLGTASISFIAGRFWKSFLRPWVESFVYNGLKLAPCYVGEFTMNGQKKTDLIDVKQKARKLWGTMTYPDGGQGLYQFEATISENVVRGTYEGVRMNPHVRGSFLLTNVPGQRYFEGWFIEPHGGAVIASRYKWIPKSS